MSIIKVFQKKNHITKDGTAPVYVYFYTQKKKIEISTKVSCKVENFDTASGKITSKEKGFKDKNMIVDKILARINNIMVKFRLSDKNLTKGLDIYYFMIYIHIYYRCLYEQKTLPYYKRMSGIFYI